MFRDLSDTIYHFLKGHGLNPLIIIIGMAIIVYSIGYKKSIKNWNSLASGDKFLITVHGIGLLIGITLCILYLIYN